MEEREREREEGEREEERRRQQTRLWEPSGSTPAVLLGVVEPSFP
jgi:hypothetical protein